MAVRGWICDETGVRVPVPQRGLLIGRSRECGIIVDDPVVSRRHALILASAAGLQVVPLGKKGIVCCGTLWHEPVSAGHRDELLVGQSRFVVELDVAPVPELWLLGVGERRYPISKPVFTVGGGDDDDLCISGWPVGAAVLHAVRDTLLVDVSEASALTVTGGSNGPGDQPRLHSLTRGSRLCRDGVEVVVIRDSVDVGPTAHEERVPTAAALEFVPRGALLHLRLEDEYTVYLPQRRADLVAALLSPPAGYAPGDWIECDALISRIWGHEGATRVQLNVVVHRARQSLSEAGLSGPTLLQCAPGGGALRFCVARGARVSVV